MRGIIGRFFRRREEKNLESYIETVRRKLLSKLKGYHRALGEVIEMLEQIDNVETSRDNISEKLNKLYAAVTQLKKLFDKGRDSAEAYRVAICLAALLTLYRKDKKTARAIIEMCLEDAMDLDSLT